jgi:hypothetical protein
VREYLRISIGTDREADALLTATAGILDRGGELMIEDAPKRARRHGEQKTK